MAAIPYGAPGVCNVLVVEDDPDILASVAAMLEAEIRAVRVLRASDAAEALALLESESVDLVLTDYRLPGPNGMAVLEGARRLAPRAARVLMTAYGEAGLVLEAINEQHIHHIELKPILGERLVCAVATLLAEA